jgi:hypothetical protein
MVMTVLPLVDVDGSQSSDGPVRYPEDPGINAEGYPIYAELNLRKTFGIVVLLFLSIS